MASWSVEMSTLSIIGHQLIDEANTNTATIDELKREIQILMATWTGLSASAAQVEFASLEQDLAHLNQRLLDAGNCLLDLVECYSKAHFKVQDRWAA